MTWRPFSTSRRVKPQLSSSNVLAGYSALKAWPWPAPSARERELRATITLLETELAQARGALGQSVAAHAVDKERLQAVCNERDGAKAALQRSYELREIGLGTITLLACRLKQIEELDTPRASHTVKKAVAIARGGDGA